jgi:hypothetical protein
MALLLVWTWVKEKIMPLGAFKAALMGTAGVSTGDVVLLHDTDYSGASTADITSGFTSTYGEYIFKFYNINPATDSQKFLFNGSIDGGSNYNVVKTTTYFTAYLAENGDDPTLKYADGGEDLAQSTGFLALTPVIGNGSDSSGAGELHLFNPSSTTYVKHFYARTHSMAGTYSVDGLTAGYFNNTDNIDAVQFKMESGNFDGTIKMWGVK